MQKTVTLIDTFGFFFRSYFAMPPLKSKSGFPTGLLTGFLNFLSRFSKEHDTDYIIFCLESKTKGFREDIYADYKGNRPDAPEDFKAQLPIAIEWLSKLGLKTMSVDGYEADDIIAAMAKIAKNDGMAVRVVSHDKDLYQLIDGEKVTIWDPSKKTVIDEAGCIEKFGVHPTLFIDFQSLVGDSVDNVPGVKGIGPKTAAKLINEYKTIENLYEHIEEIGGRTKELLVAGCENAFMSKRLVCLQDDAVDLIDYDGSALPEAIDFSLIRDEMLTYDIRHLLQKASLFEESKPKPTDKKTEKEPNYITLDTPQKLSDAISKIPADAVVAFDTETNSLDTKIAKTVGFSFAYNTDEAYYVPLAHSYLGVGEQISCEEAKKWLNTLFERKIVGHNLKFDIGVVWDMLDECNRHIHADTMILCWMFAPDMAVSLDANAKRMFGHEMIKYKETVKTGDDFSAVSIEEATKYAAEDALYTLKIYNELYPKLQNDEKQMFDDFVNIEMPFIFVLFFMERAGIRVNVNILKELLAATDEDIEGLKKEIFSLTDSEFNINSTKQLSEVLYQKLGLDSKKKTKTGLSTDERTLTKMLDSHPVIEKILLYREVFKLKSTYLEPMIELSKKNPESKIYTNFLQTGTATGRLSSKNPNLQNIPTKTESSRRIRYAFEAGEGMSLIGLDYSQIELRLLAHYSKDETLVRAFLEDRDIHLETSQKIFGESKAKENRNKAKTINFGLLYGMGSQKLSDTLQISVKEAKGLIDSYFASFPTVKEFLESIKDGAKRDGFVKTLSGRKRFFDFKNIGARDEATYLREAVNTVFQGSAADIIKTAMIKIDDYITKNNINAKMILQIHDELIFECAEKDSEKAASIFQGVMESVVKLEVPLKTSVNIGKNWGELK